MHKRTSALARGDRVELLGTVLKCERVPGGSRNVTFRSSADGEVYTLRLGMLDRWRILDDAAAIR